MAEERRGDLKGGQTPLWKISLAVKIHICKINDSLKKSYFIDDTENINIVKQFLVKFF